MTTQTIEEFFGSRCWNKRLCLFLGPDEKERIEIAEEIARVGGSDFVGHSVSEYSNYMVFDEYGKKVPFDCKMSPIAHEETKDKIAEAMKKGVPICANTDSNFEEEFHGEYIEIAREYGYDVVYIVPSWLYEVCLREEIVNEICIKLPELDEKTVCYKAQLLKELIKKLGDQVVSIEK